MHSFGGYKIVDQGALRNMRKYFKYINPTLIPSKIMVKVLGPGFGMSALTLSFIPDHGARHMSWPWPLLLTRAREDDPVPVNCSEQGILDYLHLFMCHRPGQALTNIILQKHWQHQQKT